MNAQVRFSEISARRDHIDGHDILDLTAFNTDGFDVSGKNVWIHDCTVWNQDDCIAVKGGTDMLFERITASGLGLTIGSIGADTVSPLHCVQLCPSRCPGDELAAWPEAEGP